MTPYIVYEYVLSKLCYLIAIKISCFRISPPITHKNIMLIIRLLVVIFFIVSTVQNTTSVKSKIPQQTTQSKSIYFKHTKSFTSIAQWAGIGRQAEIGNPYTFCSFSNFYLLARSKFSYLLAQRTFLF